MGGCPCFLPPVATSDVTVNWVLDPNGQWRAASTQDVETGEAKSSYKYTCFGGSTSDIYGNPVQYADRITNQLQTDYSYNDNPTITTDASGNVTLSGSGSGNGSYIGHRSAQQASQTTGTPGSLDGLVLSESLVSSDNWTQNYAQNTVNMNFTHISSWTWQPASGYAPDTESADMGWYIDSLESFYSLSPNGMPIAGPTVDTGGNAYYGIVGQPTINFADQYDAGTGSTYSASGFDWSGAATSAAGLIPVVGNYIAAASDYKNGHYIMAGVDLVFAALDESGAGEAEAVERIAANALEDVEKAKAMENTAKAAEAENAANAAKTIPDSSLPELKDSGRLGGDLPDPNQLTEEQAKQQLDKVEQSIDMREWNNDEPLDEGHQQRLDQEQQYLRDLQKRLGQ